MVQRNFSGFSKIFASSFVVLAVSACGGNEESGNNLDIGFNSKAPEKIAIGLNGLQSYNGRTIDDLTSHRVKAISEHPELLKAPYKPSADVFSFDGKSPWWGIKGHMFPGAGLDNTEGPSRESVYYGNPLLLVSPEWYGSNMHWVGKRFGNQKDFANVFPTYLPPISVTFYPKEKREEVVYDCMKYYNDVKSLLNDSWPQSELTFDLRAYNARDFGYNFIYVDANNSRNLAKLPPNIIAINQQVTTKTRGSCAPSCNDINTPDELVGFKLKGLPAKCSFLLWKKKPDTYLQSPDLKVDFICN